jgi:hypothetical protein
MIIVTEFLARGTQRFWPNRHDRRIAPAWPNEFRVTATTGHRRRQNRRFRQPPIYALDGILIRFERKQYIFEIHF